MVYNIAIDGPASAGKSTTAKNIAKRMDFIYVDTGSMYRAISYYMDFNNVDYSVNENIESVLNDIHIELKFIEKEQKVFLNNQDVTPFLRTESIGKIASAIAKNPKVREKLVNLQQLIATENNVVMDGRDIGSVVLPNANLKIYLDASVEVRAERRYKELVEKGINTDFEIIKKDIIDRDFADMNREFSPLVKADDAIYLDVSYMNPDEVLDKILSFID